MPDGLYYELLLERLYYVTELAEMYDGVKSLCLLA
jgi:hypothetical protein